MSENNNPDNPDIIEEVTKVFQNVTKLSTDVVVKQVGPHVEKSFDLFIVSIQGLVNKDTIGKLMELKDTIIDIVSPIIMPFITQVLGLAKKPMGSTDESVLEEVEEIIGTLVLTAITISVVAFLPELAHPLKAIGFNRMSALIVDMAGFGRISATIMNILVERTMGARLRYATNSLFTPYIPNQQDLIRIMVREDLGREWLDDRLKKHGFAQEWANHYWDSHWELVGIRNLYDMYHRGIIDKPTMAKMLVRHDYNPSDEIEGVGTINWPDNLIELSTSLIPRVDLRYAWEAGLIDDDELLRRMKMLGYSDQDAFFEASIQKRRTLTVEINEVRREVLKDFREGVIPEVTLRSNLADLGDTTEAIDYRVMSSQYFIERDHKRDQINEITKALGRGLIDDPKAKELLQGLQVQEWKIAQILELAELKLKLKPKEVTYQETM